MGSYHIANNVHFRGCWRLLLDERIYFLLLKIRHSFLKSKTISLKKNLFDSVALSLFRIRHFHNFLDLWLFRVNLALNSYY